MTLITMANPTFFPLQKGNRIADGAKEGDYQKINSGSVKVIFKKIASDGNGGLKLDPKRVTYLSETFLGRRELSGEAETARDIQSTLRRIRVVGESNIQTDMQVKEDIPGVDNAIDAPAAVGDLDGYIKKPELSLDTRLSLGLQVIKGMHNMQKAGYVTGDAKLENILVFETDAGPIARISDFGKARKLAEEGVSLVDGNPRFTAPEGVLTRKGEVFSTGLMLLRILEEGIDPEQCKKLQVGKRRGVEALLLRQGRPNKKGVSGQIAFVKKYMVAKTTGNISLDQGKSEEEAIHRHIDNLSSSFFNSPNTDSPKGRALLSIFELIKDMTQDDPAKRPTMEEVEKRYTAALDKAAPEEESEYVLPETLASEGTPTSPVSTKLTSLIVNDYFS